MKPQSEKLFQYLKEKRLLDAPEDALKQAKQEYRKQYLATWQQERKAKTKDIRIRFTHTEFIEISKRARAFGLCPTHYAKQVILQEQQNTVLLPHQDVLQKTLQKLAMASIQSLRSRDIELTTMLDEAETLLTNYIKQNT
jgi:hypothetical protein